MNTDFDVRPALPADVDAIGLIAQSTGLFPADMLPNMIQPWLTGSDGNHWLTGLLHETPVAMVFCEAERLTDATWNMLALAVAPEHQGIGLGGLMVEAAEAALRDAGGRLLIIDTSGTDDFARTRQFYRNNGYQPEAIIRDYYAAGDDKVTFRKLL